MGFNGQAARAAYKANADVSGQKLPIAPGWYSARIGKVVEGLVPKSGDGEMIRIDYDVKVSETDRQEVRVWYCHEHSNETTKDIAMRKLGHIVELTGATEPQGWVGQDLDVRIEPSGQFDTVEEVAESGTEAPLRRPVGGAPAPAPAPVDDDDAIPF